MDKTPEGPKRSRKPKAAPAGATPDAVPQTAGPETAGIPAVAEGPIDPDAVAADLESLIAETEGAVQECDALGRKLQIKELLGKRVELAETEKELAGLKRTFVATMTEVKKLSDAEIRISGLIAKAEAEIARLAERLSTIQDADLTARHANLTAKLGPAKNQLAGITRAKSAKEAEALAIGEQTIPTKQAEIDALKAELQGEKYEELDTTFKAVRAALEKTTAVAAELTTGLDQLMPAINELIDRTSRRPLPTDAEPLVKALQGLRTGYQGMLDKAVQERIIVQATTNGRIEIEEAPEFGALKAQTAEFELEMPNAEKLMNCFGRVSQRLADARKAVNRLEIDIYTRQDMENGMYSPRLREVTKKTPTGRETIAYVFGDRDKKGQWTMDKPPLFVNGFSEADLERRDLIVVNKRAEQENTVGKSSDRGSRGKGERGEERHSRRPSDGRRAPNENAWLTGEQAIVTALLASVPDGQKRPAQVLKEACDKFVTQHSRPTVVLEGKDPVECALPGVFRVFVKHGNDRLAIGVVRVELGQDGKPRCLGDAGTLKIIGYATLTGYERTLKDMVEARGVDLDKPGVFLDVHAQQKDRERKKLEAQARKAARQAETEAGAASGDATATDAAPAKEEGAAQ